jgi:O-antigen ligase
MLDRRELLGWLDVARSFVLVACLLAALLGFAAAVLSGVHVVTLILVPLAMLIAALSSPSVLLLVGLVILAIHGLVLTAAVVMSLVQRTTRRDSTSALPEEQQLRRRYLAGEDWLPGVPGRHAHAAQGSLRAG